MEHFLNIPIISICAYTWVAFIVAPGQLLAPLARHAGNLLPWVLFKPLFDCSACLSGWLAIAYYLSLYDWTSPDLGGVLFVVPFSFCTMFFTRLLTKYFNVYE